MTAVVPFAPGQISRVFGNGPVTDDLSAGVQASFGVIGYKGKVWSIKYRGEEVQLLRQDGDGARNSIEVVLLASAKNLSKIFYASGYTEGANAAPDCFSTDGIVPSASATDKQSPTCASCKQNVWGSKISEVSGKPTKRCADSKRIALVPLQDINNEIYGGPLLLRVPAASLQELAQYGQKMQQLGYPHYAIGTRISFDTEVSYPRFQFSAIRPLTDDEAHQVVVLRNSPAVARILAEAAELTSAPKVNAAELERVFEQPLPAQVTKDQSWTIPSAVAKEMSNTTGQASTTSAPRVAQDRGVSQEPSPVKVQDTVVPRPTVVQTQAPAGTVTTASTDQKSGFGNSAPMPETASTQSNSSSPPSEGAADPFETGLDEMMARLLPSTGTAGPR